MEENKSCISPLFEKVETYSKTSYELCKLKVVEKTANIVSTFISRAIIILMFSMFIIIATVGIALWIGDLLGKSYYGFFCVAGFYGLLGIILYYSMNSWIKKQLLNSIITQLLN